MTDSHKDQTKKNKDLEESLRILKEEKDKRIEDVRQRIEFMVASVRAQGKTQLNKMPKKVRELTLKEFCEVYHSDVKYFLQEETRKRLAVPPPNEIKKRSKSTQEEKVPMQGPLYIQVEKENHSKFSLRLDPEYFTNQVEKFKFNVPTEALSQLDKNQRVRICEQIQDLQDQLDNLKKTVLPAE